MNLKTFLTGSALALSIASAAVASPVTGIDAIKEWNLIVLGDLTSSSEVEGRTFVGGNLDGNSSNYQIRTPAASAFNVAGLTVVGDVTGGTKNLNNGSGAVVGGNVASGFNLNGAAQTVSIGGSIRGTNVNQNTVNSGLAATDSGFLSGLQQQGSLLKSSLHDLSLDFAKLEGNSDLAISGNRGTFSADPDAAGRAVFNITSSDLSKFGEIKFNLNGADTAIVNVSGTSIRLDDNFLGGTSGLGKHVIWNFPDAETLGLSTAWGGTILAPNAAATTSNYVEGSAVFGSLSQNGEFHLGTYSGNYQPAPPTIGLPGGPPASVPEPGSFAMFAVGLALISLYFARSRRRKTIKFV